MASTFDLKQYLLARQTSGVGSKLEAIDGALNEKLSQIGQVADSKRVDIGGPEALVDTLGLRDKNLRGIVNLGASLVSGTGRVVGDILSLPSDLGASMRENQVTPQQFEAYGRVANGQAQPGDAEMLQAPIVPGGKTVLDQIKEAQGMRATGAKIDKTLDFSGLVDKGAQDKLTQRLEAGFTDPWEQVKKGWEQANSGQKISGGTDMLVGAAKLIYRAGAAGLENPQATAEFIAENIPQLAIGVAGKAGQVALGASNLGYAAENYRKGLENYAKENKGAYPPDDVRQRMAMAAAGTALAEQAGDMFSLGSIKGALKPAVDAVVKEGEQLSKKGFKQALLGVAEAAGKGTASEALTEGVQTYLEGEAQLKPASASDIYVGASIGGLVGGGLTGGGRLAVESVKGAAEQASALVDEATKRQATTAATEAAKATGDVSVFTDPKSPMFAPDKAVAVLHQASMKEGVTLEELNANYTKAVDQLAQLDAKDAELSANLAQLPKSDVAGRKVLQDQLDEVAKLSGPVVKTVMAFQADVAKRQAAEVDINDLMTKASAAVDPADTAAVATQQDSVKQILVRAMQAPNSVSPQALLNLANNTGNGLTAQQRSTFRVLSEAQRTLNETKTVEGVRQEVFFGDEQTNQVGIGTYMQRAAIAAQTGNTGMGARQVQGITAFLNSHESKALVASDALQKAQSAKDYLGFKVLRKTDGTWEAQKIATKADLAAANKEIEKNGGLRVHQGSDKVVNAVAEEAQALKAAKQAMEAVLSLSSSQNPTPMVPVQQPVAGSGPAVAAAPLAATPAPAAAVAPSTLGSVPADSSATAPQPAAAAEQPKVEQPQAAQTEVVAEAAPGQEIQPADAPAETQTGKLQAIVNGAMEKAKLAGMKLNQVFRELNLIGAFMAQRDRKSETGSASPLVSQADFLSAWDADNELANKFLPKNVVEGMKEDGASKFDDVRRTAVQTALENAKATLKEWVPLLRNNLPKADTYSKLQEDFRHRDMLSFLMTPAEDGQMDLSENALTAIAYSAYQWVVDQASSPAKLRAEQLATMHGQDPDTQVTPDGQAALNRFAGFEDTVVNSLGQAAIQALGLVADKDAPKDFMPRLSVALGTHAMVMLQSQGFLRTTNLKARTVLGDYFGMDKKELDQRFPYKEDKSGVDRSAEFTYVEFAREGRKFGADTLVKIEGIKTANRYSGGVVDKLFNAEKAPRYAQTQPSKFKQQFAKGTQQAVPKVLRKVLQASQDTPHQVIPEMLQLAAAMGKQNLLKAAGFVDMATTPVHILNESSVEAQNDNLANQYELMMEMLALDPSEAQDFDPELFKSAQEQQFFIEHSVWKNFRVGVTTQSLNLQSSKIHRFMFTRPNWKTTVKMDDLAEFKISVAQALGVKVDKTPNAVTLNGDDVAKIFNSTDSDFAKAADVIRAGVLEGQAEVWTDEAKALVAKVSAGNEGMMTLQGLMALAKYQQAVKTGATSFEVTLLVGADGKTNGPILTHLALGAGLSQADLYTMLNRGGMYANDDDTNHYSEFAAGGGLDLYQDLASTVLERVFEQHGKSRALEAFQRITKPLLKDGEITSAARNLMKTPMTSFAFGSALEKSVANMEEAFLNGILDAIEGLATGKREDIADAADLVRVINSLMENGNGQEMLAETMDLNGLLDWKPTYRQLNALRATFKELMGDTVVEVMDTKFAVFIERRRALNKAIESSYALYEAAFAAAKDNLVQELMASGEIASRITKTGVQVPLHDLSQAQEDSLRKSLEGLLPVMHTNFSKVEGNLDAGLWMGKTESALSDDPLYLSRVEMAVPVEGRTAPFLENKARVRKEKAPGAAGTPYAIHSSDSSNMHMALQALGQAQALNVHDEISTGVGSIAKAAEAINKATVETFLNYSPAAEARNMLVRQLVALDKAAKAGALSQSEVRTVFEQLAANYNHKKPKKLQVNALLAPDMVLSQITALAYEADQLRLGVLSTMKVMDQYTWEGGQFKLTPKIQAEAKAKLDALTEAVPQEALDALGNLKEFLLTKGGKEEKTKRGEVLPWESDIDDAPVAQSAEQLGVAGVRAPVVVGQAGGVPEQVREEVRKGTSVVEAINAQPEAERAVAIQAVAQAASEIPPWEVSPWGELGGSPASRHHQGLVDFLAFRKEVGLKETVTFLKGMFQGSTQNAPMVSLMNRIAALAPANLKVVYVTPDTPVEAVLAKPEFGNSRGWWVADGDKEHIYILSTDFKHSAVHAEVMVHELLHSVLSSVIDSPKTAEAKALVAELEQLLAEVRKHPEAVKYGNAGLDVHELVSWGMTNRKFQTEVLAKIQMPEHRGATNKLVSGMQAFVKALRAFFFRGIPVSNRDKANNALTILLTNTAGLFEAAAQAGIQQRAQARQVKTRSQQAPGTQSPVMRYTTEQLFDALGANQVAGLKTLSTEFVGQLRNTLSSIVTHIYGAGGNLAANQAGTVAMTPVDVWVKAQMTGEAPFVSKITPQMQVTDQEAFVIEQVEATLRTALSDEASTSLSYKELGRLYEEARRRLKPSDFPSQELYDFLFKIEQGADKRSDYLTRFAALGLGHQEVNKALDRAAEVISRRPGAQAPDTMSDRLVAWFQKALVWLSGMATRNNPGEALNLRLKRLADQLVDIEAKKRAKLARGPLLGRFIGESDMLKNGVSKVRLGAAKVAQSGFVRNNWFSPVKLTGSVAGIVLKEQVDQVVDKALALRDLATQERFGIAAGLVNSVKGPNEVFQFLLRNMKKLEKDRQDIIFDVSKILRESYKDKGENLTSADKAAISAVFLRSGAHVLLGSTTGNAEAASLTMADLQQLLEVPAAMDAAIRTRIDVLGAQPDLVHYYVYQAKALAYHRAVGKQRSALGMMNAGNIARLHGTHLQGSVSEAVAARVEPIIDELSSLYALQYSNGAHLDTAKEVLRQEIGRTDGGNGVEMTLRMHKRLENESRQRLFAGNEVLQMKGYVSEIFNPHTAVAVARDVAEKQVLMEQGYAVVGDLSLDPSDPDKRAPTLFVLKDGGQMPYTTASMSLTGMAAKGTVRYGGMSNAFEEGVANTAKANQLSEQRKLDSERMFRAQPKWDPRLETKSYMTPVLNSHGTVVAWRYMMDEKTKDDVLERDHRFDQVLGSMAGSIFDKQTSVRQNTDVVEALHALYEREYSQRPQSFVRISHDSANAEHREIYRLLPDTTQETIREIWGPHGMLVPQELLDVVFGYRKVSLTKAFDKKAALREAERLGYTPSARDQLNSTEAAFVAVVEGAMYTYARGVKLMNERDAHTFARTAGVRMRRGERAVQEIVREIKDTIVIRGINTMIGNIKSNMSLLLIHGVSPWELAHHHWVAIKGATDYRTDRAELANLRLKLASGYTLGNEDEIQRRIAELEDALVRNPVRELIDAGLMPTIVEDVGEDDDIYSYKAQFTKKVDSLVAGLNPHVLEAGKLLYMAHDTPIYQSLSHITQLSDFVARYTLYQHAVNRKKNPLSKAEAIQLASDSFVNYDIPMHRGLQYLDDMGITMFSKYFYYIQRVLLKLGKDRPVQMLMAAALHQYFGRMDLVTESSAVYRLGNNPFHLGPLGIVYSPAELPAVQIGMALLDGGGN